MGLRDGLSAIKYFFVLTQIANVTDKQNYLIIHGAYMASRGNINLQKNHDFNV